MSTLRFLTDFEACIKLTSGCELRSDKSFTFQYQKHKPCGCGSHIVCFDKLYSEESVIKRVKSEDDDVAQIFLEIFIKNSTSKRRWC